MVTILSNIISTVHRQWGHSKTLLLINLAWPLTPDNRNSSPESRVQPQSRVQVCPPTIAPPPGPNLDPLLHWHGPDPLVCMAPIKFMWVCYPITACCLLLQCQLICIKEGRWWEREWYKFLEIKVPAVATTTRGVNSTVITFAYHVAKDDLSRMTLH